VIGDGPERSGLAEQAMRLGVSDRVEFTGALTPPEALERSRQAWLFVMPSTAEAFGVAYVEAMAAGIVAIGAAGEPGPAEIAALGQGMELVKAHDPTALAAKITSLLAAPERLAELGLRARETVAAHFNWRRCGEETIAAYAEALR
jgi:glycosyltransferase involved in cell wall biosynthesis